MMRDQFAGCLLGLALGDALGAPYESGLLEHLAIQVGVEKNIRHSLRLLLRRFR